MAKQHVRDATARLEIAQPAAGAQKLDLNSEIVVDAGAEALATVLASSTTLKKLKLSGSNEIGPMGALAIAAAIDREERDSDVPGTRRERHRCSRGCGVRGRPSTRTRLSRPWYSPATTSVLKALALAAALEKNATLTSLRLDENEIGDEGALALAAALDKNATLTSLYINDNSSARIKHSFCETLATGHRNLHRRESRPRPSPHIQRSNSCSPS